MLIEMRKRSSYLSECLSNDSAAVRNGVGKNVIPPPERESLWRQYLGKFKDPIIIILLVVFFLSVVVAAYEIVYMDKGWSIMLEPSGVLIALLLATGVGFIFEVKAGKEFEVLNKVKDARPVKVMRRMTEGGRPKLMMIKNTT